MPSVDKMVRGVTPVFQTAENYFEKQLFVFMSVFPEETTSKLAEVEQTRNARTILKKLCRSLNFDLL
jgi:hypothetical protein